MRMLRQVIYVSHRPTQTTTKDVEEILSFSRRRNLEDNIKGILVSLPKHFYQVIEGPVKAISNLLNRIEHDSRHHSMRVFSDKLVGYYEYGGWEMLNYEIDEELKDYFWVLSKYAQDIQLRNANTMGIEMILKGLAR